MKRRNKRDYIPVLNNRIYYVPRLKAAYIKADAELKEHPLEVNHPEMVGPLKGDYDGECNRACCSEEQAHYYNFSTRRWYCERCAMLINDNNLDYLLQYGKKICEFQDSPDNVKDY